MNLTHLSVALAFLFLQSRGIALSVRVDASQGAPRLVVNGRPVRARMFYGSYGSYRLPPPAPLPVPAGAHTLSFDFTARATDPGRATLHFRFGQVPGEIDLDNIHVTDLDTHQEVLPTRTFEGGASELARDWAVWPAGAASTVGIVQDVLSGLAVGQGPHPSLNLVRGETRVLILSPARAPTLPSEGRAGVGGQGTSGHRASRSRSGSR